MKNYRIEAAILAVGLALAGLFVYCGFKAFSQRDRVVSVRGLSEREVGARLGITQSVVNKRKARILRKLRKIIEN